MAAAVTNFTTKQVWQQRTQALPRTLSNLWCSRAQCQKVRPATRFPSNRQSDAVHSVHSLGPSSQLHRCFSIQHIQWLMDSGATHHIISNLNNLAYHQSYNGGTDVMIAGGSTVLIQQTGSSLLSTQPRSLNLHKVLYVLNINKNLISVYQICNSNGVSVKFFLTNFQLKDLRMGVPLICSRTRADLYEWPHLMPQANATSTSLSSKATLCSRHSRLGHPSLSILNTVISSFNSFNLPISSFSKISVLHWMPY